MSPKSHTGFVLHLKENVKGIVYNAQWLIFSHTSEKICALFCLSNRKVSTTERDETKTRFVYQWKNEV